MSSATLLETVATHETELRAQIDSAKAEARNEIEAAHAAASTHISEAHAQLDADIAARRRESANARLDAENAVNQKAEAKIEEIRTQAAGRLDAVREQLVAAILPQREGA